MVNVKTTFELGRQRTKRSAVSHTGAKVCHDDSVSETLASHQAYFKLRVCQVSVWEAFRVFLDRIPSSIEYDSWVSTCQLESLCMIDLLRNFSASQEHMDVVSKKLSVLDEFEEESQSETSLSNTLPEQAAEHVVEFSVTVVDPGFSELLNDTSNPHYYDFTRSLHKKMLHVFDKLPGFKEFRILGFRAGGVSVRYAVVFETLTLDTEEVGEGSADEDEEGVGSDSGNTASSSLKQIVTKALTEEKSLPVDVGSICFDPGAFTVDDDPVALTSGLHQTTLAPTVWPPANLIIEKQLEGNVNESVPHKPMSLQAEETTRGNLTPRATTEPTADRVTSTTQTEVYPMPLKEPVDVPDVTESPQHVEEVTLGSSPTDAHRQEAHKEGPPSQTVAPLPKDADTMDFQKGYPAETEQVVESEASTHDPPLNMARQGKELVVFFSLRVTNLMFSTDLFNKSSPEYRSLENTFLEVTQISDPKDSSNPGASSKSETGRQRTLASIPLLPYLQSNLSGFKELEILNFRNGSVIVNSKMKFAESLPYNVTKAVHCVLQDFCNAASKRLDIEIDSRSLDIETADQADPCRFTACNEFSRCVVNRWTQEPECLCNPGYSSVNGQPCQSVCALEPGYCLNGGQCEIVPGHGAACRCPVGKYWHFHGERCTELVSVPVDPFLFVICFVGFLLFVLAVIGLLLLINRKCIRTRKTVTLVHSRSPFSFGNTMRVNPVFESDDSTLTRVSSLNCTSSSGTSSSRFSEHDTLDSIENMHLSIEIPRQLYTTRPDKLVSEMVDFHHCIPFPEKWRLSKEYRTSCCLLRTGDNECLEVTVL
ncbi:interphotoreceptor matrix proteoglycan 1 [Scleropages formosus]|uniref:interphotoreceptor matrix proteoglycan 1 n=1 Tax=Scleropages formosus TaxID=113540 RepID=UPI0010FA8960|nr:interphotoreceptor matrix proteoglycan 1-like [Scleropages formosus]